MAISTDAAASLGQGRSRRTQLPMWRLKRVQAFVSAHIGEPLRLTDLAEAAGLSRMHFAAQFRSATGVRPHDYVLMQRVERAKTMLRSTDMPLAEIALSVGFQAQAHFCTVFKRFEAETPARWRKNNFRQSNAATPQRCLSRSGGDARAAGTPGAITEADAN
jgi:AraC family transcriptional regulator